MRRWIRISLALFLIIVNPTFSKNSYFTTLLNRVANVFNTIGGVSKFTKESILYKDNRIRDRTPKNGGEYDFIIIGAGSAGATIAGRMSETDQKILLLEAGGHESLPMDVPLIAIALQISEDINWGYLAEPSNHYCLGYENRQCKIPRGKVLGGTSVINGMIAIRGNKKDYDEWAELTGDSNWSYEGMLQSFKKMENFDYDLVGYDDRYHNFSGPIHITQAPYRTPLADAFIKAGEEMGFSSVDYNGPTQTGFNYVQTNQINGERVSTNRAYLWPAKNRRNLVVSIKSHVNKVLIDPRTKTAYGVEFTKYGRKIRVRARKEVILSAGAIASPQLLMLSGVGPREHLESFGINVVKDAPVGQNMIDHVSYAGLIFLINQPVSIIISTIIGKNSTALSDYFYKRTGPLTTPSAVEGLGYVNVDNLRDKTDNPNFELMFTSATVISNKLGSFPYGITGKYWDDYFAKELEHHAYYLLPMLLKPKSRGKILLRSGNPKDKPRIIPNYFSDPDDLRDSIKGIRLAIKVSKTKSMQRYGSHLINRLVPGCEKYEYDSDAYWECALRTYTVPEWHQISTCKMGREDDPYAVVNSRLQVKGIKNLRVADASVMPSMVSAHLNIPTIAIGEKFSDILKSDYGLH